MVKPKPREYERGTMENLLSMPLRASEVLVGKITPYILVDYVQVGVILLVAHFLFKVPVHGNLVLLLLAALFFRRKPCAWNYILDGGALPVASDANGDVCDSSFDPTVRISVPISRDAMVGAGSWRDFADYPFSPRRARSYVEGDRFCGCRTRTLADHSLCRNHARRSGEKLSADPGLEPEEIDWLLQSQSLKAKPSRTAIGLLND
jgi:hypothetical protein